MAGSGEIPWRRPILDQEDAYDNPRTFRVFVEDEFRFGYDPMAFRWLQDVIENILKHIAAWRADGLKEWDLAVWQDCRIVAVVRTGHGGEPIVTTFIDPED